MNTTRERKPLAPVNPAVLLLSYNATAGSGLISIDGTVYTLTRHTDRGRTTGVRLAYVSEDIVDGFPVDKVYDIDLSVNPPTCDCPDGTYRSERPGGCKHIVALRSAGETLRASGAMRMQS